MVIGVGIIGLSADHMAWATLAHVNPLKAPDLSNHYTLTAVGTSSPESAQAAAKSHGIPVEKAYSKPEDLANDPDVDMVVVSVKVHMHYGLTMPALKAKKDVFVEWPLGNDLAEAEELAALAKKQGVKTIVGLQARLNPAMVKVKEIVDSGALGRIVSTTIFGADSSMLSLPEKARYFNDPKCGASLLSIACAHTLDPILHTLGEFSSLSATTSILNPTITYPSSPPEPRLKPDNILIHGTLTSGTSLNFQYQIPPANTIPAQYSWTLIGEKGALKVEGTGFQVQMMDLRVFQSRSPRVNGEKDETGGSIYDQKEEGSGPQWVGVEIEKSNINKMFGGIGEVYEAFAEKGREGVVGFEEAVTRHRMVEAIERSARDGRRE
ncbi:MAG: hypothetical protein Q9190_006495, partial [Brigantiaea leucoxantha]